MALDEMSIEELKALNLDLVVILKAAQALDALTSIIDQSEVRIGLVIGRRVTITAPWRLVSSPDVGADDPGPFLIKDEPEIAPAEGMVGGSGDLQRHCHAEGPPVEPAASTPETGESPEAPVIDAEAPAEAIPVAPAGETFPEIDLGGGDMANDANPNAWSDADENRLIETVAERLAAGDTRKGAVAHAAALIGRTAAASDFRLRRKLADRLSDAIRQLADRSDGGAPEARPEPAPAPAPAAADPAMTASQRAIAAALARVPGRKGFDADLDLEVVEGYALGSKTDALALTLDLDAREVLARMKELTACIRDDRGHLTIDGQADLMAVLRHRLREARGAAA